VSKGKVKGLLMVPLKGEGRPFGTKAYALCDACGREVEYDPANFKAAEEMHGKGNVDRTCQDCTAMICCVEASRGIQILGGGWMVDGKRIDGEDGERAAAKHYGGRKDDPC